MDILVIGNKIMMRLLTPLIYTFSILICFYCTEIYAQSLPALSFGGTDAYVTFGNTSTLGLPQFTIETWFMTTGSGVATSTGTGGINAIPLIAKGRAEVDGDNRDLNYFLGISNTTGCLVADFEEGTGQPNPGLNHPVNGITPINNNIWYHSAATYNGTDWKLYLNGILEAQLTVGFLPQSGSIQHASLAAALNSSGAASGFFSGVLDEARIWNYARTLTEIQNEINVRHATPQPGLIAVWGMNEGVGIVVHDSSSNGHTGTISGLNYQWQSTGAPFNLSFNLAPGQPTQFVPADSASCVSTSPVLQVHVTDPEGDSMSVVFYLAMQTQQPPADFTLIGLPDTQYYTGELNGGTNEILKSQIQWIVNNLDSLHIVFVEGLGDCVQNGDNGSNPVEWMRCDTALGYMEDTVTTQLSDGLPYGMNVGNHDQTPEGDASGTTTLFNQYFGSARFSGRSYYGGHFGNDNNTNYCLFSSGGLDFIIINFEYDDNRDTAELNWAHNLLNLHSNRRAILASHYILELNGSFSAQGQLLYDAFKTHANVFMTMSGHVPGESARQDSYLGNTIYSVMSDYQGRSNGGNGWLRLYHFSPANNTIFAKTYSPWLNQWETDANSQFSHYYLMAPSPNFQAIDSVTHVPSASNAFVSISGLLPNTTYQWYVTVSDTGGTTTSQVHYFTTAALQPVSLGNDTTICNTCSLNLSAGSGYSTYLWQDGSTMMNYSATSAGTYHVQVMDSAGCISSDSITIGVFPFVNVESGYECLIAFPNPVEAELCLTGDFLKIKTEMTIRITDLSGRTVYHSNIFKKNIDNRIMIVTTDFHPGLYVVEVIFSSGILRKKIIKQ